MKYTVFVLMTATKEWLSLTREQRGSFVDKTLNPIISKYADKVNFRFFDAEAFTARCSDIAVFETSNLQDYYFLMEELRDTAMFSQPYFQVNDILPSIENGFMTFEEEVYQNAHVDAIQAMQGKSNKDTPSKREAIIDAARRLFAEKGYEETTIADVAKTAGMAVGTVYLYFRNKHEIYTDVSLDFGTKLAEAFSNPAITSLPIQEIPRAMIDTAFRVCRENMELMSLMQIDMQSPGEVTRHKESKEHITRALNTFFRHTIEQGHLAPFNTEMYARLFNLLGSALLHQCFAVEKGEREALYRQYAIEFIERMFFGPSLQEGMKEKR